MKDVNDPKFWDDAKKAAEAITKNLEKEMMKRAKEKNPDDPCDDEFMEEISS